MAETMGIELVNFREHVFNEDFHVPESATEWLQELSGPVVIDVNGRDSSRTRVISTLLHANEPSGFIGVHRWLKNLQDGHEKYCPATNVRILLSSVEAAKQLPLFHQRFVDGDADLNRLFTSDNQASAAGKRALAIKNYIADAQPEAVVDLHNTSGIGQPFAVAVNAGNDEQMLASYFCQTMILTHLNLGALMEQDFSCPIITVECGGVSDDMSHEVAYQGIVSFVCAPTLMGGHHVALAKIFKHPLRVELTPGSSISYANELNPATDVTLVPHIEKFNMGITGGNSLLGWSTKNELPIRIVTEDGLSLERKLLKCENNKILTTQSLRIFMATPNAVIAKKIAFFMRLRMIYDPSYLFFSGTLNQ